MPKSAAAQAAKRQGASIAFSLSPPSWVWLVTALAGAQRGQLRAHAQEVGDGGCDFGVDTIANQRSDGLVDDDHDRAVDALGGATPLHSVLRTARWV
jgi:hypothetical protein